MDRQQAIDSDGGESRELGSPIPSALLALGLLALLYALFDYLLPDDTLEFGSTVFAPTPGYGRFLGAYFFFGGGACLALAWSLSTAWARRQAPARSAFLEAWSQGASDRRFMVYCGLLAFLLPALIRTYLLGGLPITDDEGAYRLMARLLGSGRLYGESPPFEVFFDRLFVINNGRYYSQYFLGWPALMAPFAVIGLHGFANAFYSAFTVPALFFTLRRLVGSPWARLGVILYLLSPMMMVAAATELSHTSCLCALAWLLWLSLRSTDEDSGLGTTAAVALVFSIAFWVRPLSALGAGAPLLLPTLWAAWRHPARLRRLLAFALPAALMGGLFLLTNWAQNGSPMATAYGRYLEYSITDDSRPTHQVEKEERSGEKPDPPKEMEFVSLSRSLAVTAAGLLRSNVALFGWPFSFLFLAFAGWRRPFLPWIWASVIGFLISHLPVGNVGIDAFAPMHFIELGWPALLLTVVGLERLWRRSSTWAERAPGDGHGARFASLGISLALASTLVALLVYAPVRGRALARMSDEIGRPYGLVEQRVEAPAVVFALSPFVSYCRHRPTQGWLHQRPINSPDFDDDILWARHLSVEANRLFLQQRYPDRRGWLIGWNEQCQLALVPLDSVDPRSVPDAQFDFSATLEALRRQAGQRP